MVRRHTHNGADSPQLDFSSIEELANTTVDEKPPLDKVDDPSGGGTVDSECRAQVEKVIDRLETLGLINKN